MTDTAVLEEVEKVDEGIKKRPLPDPKQELSAKDAVEGKWYFAKSPNRSDYSRGLKNEGYLVVKVVKNDINGLTVYLPSTDHNISLPLNHTLCPASEPVAQSEPTLRKGKKRQGGSRRVIILKGMREGKTDDEILEEVIKTFTDAPRDRVKGQISGNRSWLKTHS